MTRNQQKALARKRKASPTFQAEARKDAQLIVQLSQGKRTIGYKGSKATAKKGKHSRKWWKDLHFYGPARGIVDTTATWVVKPKGPREKKPKQYDAAFAPIVHRN